MFSLLGKLYSSSTLIIPVSNKRDGVNFNVVPIAAWFEIDHMTWTLNLSHGYYIDDMDSWILN